MHTLMLPHKNLKLNIYFKSSAKEHYRTLCAEERFEMESHWAIPEIRCTPPKEDMGIPKNFATFFIGKSQKIKHFFGCKGKKTWEFPKYSITFSTQNGNSQFFTIFDIKNWEFPCFKTIFRIPIF